MNDTNQQPLDEHTCRAARLSRDPRFDGEFYLGVVTTGIYCRPICPARAPAEQNVRYFRDASQAAQAGFRPCLRCRPESAPGSPAWSGTSTTVQRALALIREGSLNGDNLAALAARLGVGERYLRKLFQRELGVSPQAVALNQRLLFAKKLLAETELPLTDVAFAAGFGSVRRFNSAVREQFRLTPGELRRQQRKSAAAPGITLQLAYRPPYDWPLVAGFFARHAIAGLETVSEAAYTRRIAVAGRAGHLSVSPIAGRDALRLVLDLPDHGQLMPIVQRVRRMFDLDANPQAIGEVLSRDSRLRPLLAQHPGVRSPGPWSLFECAARAVVGQQVSTAAARTVLARLVTAARDAHAPPDFPSPAALGSLGDEHFAMPGGRRDTLRRVCALFRENQDPDLEAIAALRGVGPWTVQLIAMRGLGDPDVFPAKDLGILKAWDALGGGDAQSAAAHWRPWRSYATNLLWRSLSQ
ncbi:MAG: DNA-3-methyladenine glycosylase 2 family protein [Halioglobus sp.]|nr:DNA-3-methyladenine glycosylase 2 family protein [Halioglobus sp.]